MRKQSIESLLALFKQIKQLLGIRTALILTCMCPDLCRSAPASLDCIKELSVPRYTYLARRAATGGTAKAVVTVGPGGKVDTVDIITSEPDIGQEVRTYLVERSTYVEACVGRKVELLFTFRLEGKPEWHPPVWVRFRPPNQFIIISRPEKPIIN